MESIQRFRIDGVLGQGGMGTVYRAWDPDLERAVAIKVLASDVGNLAILDESRTVDLRDPRSRDAKDVLAEARAMAAISHSNVLPIYEVGRIGDRVFLVMELVDGNDLRQWLAAAPRSTSDVLAVLEDGARGLAAAHERGVVHGDFKPDNLLVKSDGRAVVADFGVSSFVVPRQDALVRTDGHRGTPAYLAPEVWRGTPPNLRSDVFSFAMTATEALLGERPSTPDGPDELAAISRALGERGVSAPIRSAIVRGLDPDPAARPEHGGAVLDALRGATTIARPRRRRWWIAAASGLGALGIAGAFVARGGAPRCEPDPRRYATIWSAERARALRAADFDGASRLAAAFDRRFARATESATTACRDRASGKLGDVQYASVVACLDRLTVEIDERITFAIAQPKSAGVVADSTPDPDDCAGRLDAPMADPAKQRELLRRYFAAVAMPALRRRVELPPLLELAVAAKDRELAARIQMMIGAGLASSDLQAAFTAIQAARNLARDAGSVATELRALADHIKVARTHTQLVIAKQIADEARPLLEGSPTSYGAERLTAELAFLARDLGNNREAQSYLRELLATLEANERGDTSTAIERRLDLIVVTAALKESPPAEFRTFVEETERMARAMYGGPSNGYFTKAVSMLVAGYRKIGDPHGEELWKELLELVRTYEPPAGASSLAYRSAVAGEMFLRDAYDDAAAVLREVVRDSAPDKIGELVPRVPADVEFASRRHESLRLLAIMLAVTGQHEEARGLAEEALVLATGSVGPRHEHTRRALDVLVGIELDMGDVANGARHLVALERALPEDPEVAEIANLDIYKAQLARLRGDLDTAESIATRALAALTEVNARRGAIENARRELGRMFLARENYPAALEQLRSSLPPLEERRAMDCDIVFEVAKLESRLGDLQSAREHAAWCVGRLASSASLARRRAEIEAWLADQDSAPSRGAQPR